LFLYNLQNTSFVRNIDQQGGLQVSIPFSPGVSPTAQGVQAHLLSIPALNPLVDPDNNPSTNNSVNVPSVTVLGGTNGPFTVIFNGALANTPQPLLQNAVQAGTNTTSNTFANILPQITVAQANFPIIGTVP